MGRLATAVDLASSTNTRTLVFIDGWQLSTSAPLSIVYYRNACSALLIFTNSPSNVTLSLFHRLCGRHL